MFVLLQAFYSLLCIVDYNPSKLSPTYVGAKKIQIFLRFGTKIHQKRSSQQNVWYKSPKKCHLGTTKFGVQYRTS